MRADGNVSRKPPVYVALLGNSGAKMGDRRWTMWCGSLSISVTKSHQPRLLLANRRSNEPQCVRTTRSLSTFSRASLAVPSPAPATKSWSVRKLRAIRNACQILRHHPAAKPDGKAERGFDGECRSGRDHALRRAVQVLGSWEDWAGSNACKVRVGARVFAWLGVLSRLMSSLATMPLQCSGTAP